MIIGWRPQGDGAMNLADGLFSGFLFVLLFWAITMVLPRPM
jgi:hypothetical protein